MRGAMGYGVCTFVAAWLFGAFVAFTIRSGERMESSVGNSGFIDGVVDGLTHPGKCKYRSS